jgi:hypothetical protein
VVEIATDRDLYCAVSQLIAQYQKTARPLEEYLRALWNVAHRHREQTALTPDEFFRLLTDSFTAEPQGFDDGFRNAVVGSLYALDLADTPGFQGWEYRVVRQITDLREMAEAGQLADELRHFGIDSPRG